MVGEATGDYESYDFQFEIIATDLSGNRISFSMPLLFVGEPANNDLEKINLIMDAYNDAYTIDKRLAEMGSATICFAPFDPTVDKGDPRLPTKDMTFAAGRLKKSKQMPNFYPETEASHVGIPVIQKLLQKPDTVIEVTYPPFYKDHGFGEADPSTDKKNQGMVFLQLKEAYQLKFGELPGEAKSDSLGSLVTPQMAIQGLSKTVGPVSAKLPSDPKDPKLIEDALKKSIFNNKFDPSDFFNEAKILGGISLADILPGVINSLERKDVPKMLSIESPDSIETTFDWETEINRKLEIFIPNADKNPSNPTKLVMHSKLGTPIKSLGKTPPEVSYETKASLNNFKVNLFGFIVIWFESLRFTATKGQKPDVTVDLKSGTDGVQFYGPLEFVNELRNLIPSNGFSDPPSLEVTPSGISAGYSLTLPAVNVGIFTLSGVSLGAKFNLPFDSKPVSVGFNFAERQHPFSLTVSLLGGGGFFAIGISTRGIQEIEAALEFGEQYRLT